MCKCLSVVGRILIGILSLLFAILGFALLVIGILVKTNTTVFNQYFDPLLQMVKDQATKAGGITSLPTDNFTVQSLVGNLALLFIILGLIMLAVGVFGVAGACCKVKCMLIVYTIIVLILLISQVIFIIILVVNRAIVTEPPKSELKTAFRDNYAGIRATDAVSLMWNAVMNGLQCCGIDGETDITSAPKWQMNERDDLPVTHPVACCKEGKFDSAVSACVTTPDSSNSNINIGCYDAFWDYILTGTPFIIFCCADIGSLALLAIFSIIILVDISKEENSPV